MNYRQQQEYFDPEKRSVQIFSKKLTQSNLLFTDVIPEGATYVEDSFTVNSVAATPTLTGNTLTYTIPTILGLALATISFQVEVVGVDI